MTAVLQARKIMVSRGGRRLLGPLTAEFAAGQFVGVIGTNGAGKTTLLRALGGILDPSQGDVLLDSRPLASWRPRERARRIGFLPQERECAWPLTTERVVALGRLPFGGGTSADHEAIEAALTAAEVADIRDRRMDELSGGERARVLLARVLAGAPGVILADEPVSGLDPGHALRILEVLQHRARAGALVVAVIHDLTLAARSCDRVLLLDRGLIVAEGTPREVMTEARLEPAFGIRARTIEHDGHLAVLTLEARR